MAGLDRDGFTPKTYTEIKDTIEGKLLVINPDFDVSSESPDGQLVGIMALEIAQAWNELNMVHRSYDPAQAIGSGLRNLGFITGIPYGSATRSNAFVNLTGVAGTIVPKGAIVTNNDGTEFFTEYQAVVPSTVRVNAGISGPIDVSASTITTIKSPVAGWTGVTNLEGRIGKQAQTDLEFRNTRTRTVMRNFVGIADTIRARLLESGLDQIAVLSNNTNSNLPDGTPPQAIHVTVGVVSGVSDTVIAQSILATKGLGTLTFGATTISVEDSQGNSHSVSFTKAVAVPIYISIDLRYLDPDFAGAAESIKRDLSTHINNLQTSGDVIWSRLFENITPYGKAQVNSLTIGKAANPVGTANIAITDAEFATLADADIVIVES